MEYITCIERRGIDKGRQEGRQEGEKNALKGAIITTLEARFKEMPWQLREQINQVEDLSRLTALLRKAATCTAATCTAINEFNGVE